jgi:hypothetical protein
VLVTPGTGGGSGRSGQVSPDDADRLEQGVEHLGKHESFVGRDSRRE